MKFRLLLIAVLVVKSSATWAISGNELLELMQRDNKLAAMMYIRGVFDVLNGDRFCAPKNATAGQIYDLVQSHLKGLPQFRHHNAAVLIGGSLETVYPCSK